MEVTFAMKLEELVRQHLDLAKSMSSPENAREYCAYCANELYGAAIRARNEMTPYKGES